MGSQEFGAVMAVVAQAQELTRAGRTAEAVSLLEDNLRRFPHNPYVAVALAQSYLKARRLPEAESLLREVLMARPGYAPALAAQAEYQEITGNLEGAAELLELAYRSRPSPYLVRRRINVYLKLKRLDEAVALCREELEKDPNNAGFYALLGRTREAAGDFAEAAAAYQRAAELNPKDAFSRRRYLELKARLAGADPLKETKNLLKAVKGRSAAELHAWRGQELKRLSRLAEAAEEYRLAQSLDPENGFYREQLAFILYRLGRYEEALPLLKAAAEHRPEDQVIRSTLVKAFQAAGRAAEGAAFFSELVGRYPHCRAIWGAVRRLENFAGGEKK